MEEKIFEFYGLDFKRVAVTSLAASLVGLAVAVAVGYFIIFINHPAFYFFIAAGILFAATINLGKYYKILWKITVSGKQVEIYGDGKLRGRFLLSEIRKLKINGWFRWQLENASKLLEKETEKPREARSRVGVWETKNPYLILLSLKNVWKNLKKREKGSHRSLTITTDDEKFSIMLGNIDFINTSDRREILIFDEFFLILENYAVKQKYEKITVNNHGLSPAYVKSYCYLRK